MLYTCIYRFCWKYFYLQVCKLDFRSHPGKGPSSIIADSSVQIAVLKPFTWEIILSILLLYTPRAYTQTHIHERYIYLFIFYCYFIMIYLHALVNNYLKIVLALRFVYTGKRQHFNHLPENKILYVPTFNIMYLQPRTFT